MKELPEASFLRPQTPFHSSKPTSQSLTFKYYHMGSSDNIMRTGEGHSSVLSRKYSNIVLVSFLRIQVLSLMILLMFQEYNVVTPPTTRLSASLLPCLLGPSYPPTNLANSVLISSQSQLSLVFFYFLIMFLYTHPKSVHLAQSYGLSQIFGVVYTKIIKN